jgi:hypothetical protein
MHVWSVQIRADSDHQKMEQTMSRVFTPSIFISGAIVAIALLNSSAAFADPINGHRNAPLRRDYYNNHHERYEHHRRPSFALNINNGPYYGPQPFSYRPYGHRPFGYRPYGYYPQPSPFYYPSPVVRHETVVYRSAPPTYYDNDDEQEADDGDDDRYCREFQKQVVVGGRIRDGYGRACRQPDGDWELDS